jgi:hypothetical protein
VRAVNLRSQSRRNLAARGINIPLPGVNGRMLTANQTPSRNESAEPGLSLSTTSEPTSAS